MSIILLKKSLNNGVIFPTKIAKSLIKSSSGTKNVIDKVNKVLEYEAISYKDTKDVYKDIKSKKNKSILGLKERYDLALIDIVANSILNELKDTSKRQKAIWLPSGSSNPSLEHMANYGEEFYLDEGINGELPAERYNCQCGLRLID